MKIRFRSLRRAAAIAFILLPSIRSSAWTSFNLPALSKDFGAYEAANLPDGQLIYGSTNSLDLQTSFGGSSISPYSHPKSWDPSSIAIRSATLGVIGAGTFGPSEIYSFNPSSLTAVFTPIPGLSTQNYNLVFRDGTSIYVGGANGTRSGGDAISYVKLDGSVNKIIIDNVSTYSGGFATDSKGDLYVTDDDNLGLYEFTPKQLNSAITGSALSIADGKFVTKVEADASVAVDSEGRIWTAGYQIDGIDMFDPSNGLTTLFTPGVNDDDYVVSTFFRGTQGFVGYLNASGSNAGSAVTYGYADVASLIPEPSVALLLAFGAGAGVFLRSRRPRTNRAVSMSVLLILAAVCGKGSVQAGPFAPAAGQPGSTAVAADDPRFVGWATGYVDFVRGSENIADPALGLASFGTPENALGPSDVDLATGYTSPVVSLGDGGSITLTFAHPIINGPGADFAVFENSFSDTFLELAFVEVSSDGVHFFRFPSISLTQTGTQIGPFGALDPTNLYDLAGKYRGGYGTPFDLSELSADSGPNLDLQDVTEVRITDVIGSIDPLYATQDSKGNIVNDPWPTPYPSCGFDLDAVGVLNQLAPEPADGLLFGGAAILLSRRWRRPA